MLRVYARAGETVQMGSSAMGLTSPFQPLDGYDNILVYPPATSFASALDPTQPAPLPTDPVFSTEIFDCNADDPGTGRISTRAQELAGPAPNPGGYTPCEFVAPADGTYPIIMLPYNLTITPGGPGTVGTPLVTVNQRSTMSIWDVTVRDAGGVIQPGRLFSNHLRLVNPPTTNASGVNGYIYTPSGYEYRVNLFGHDGENWELAANDRGVVDATSGERIFASFQWGNTDIVEGNTLVHTEAVAPQLADPDLAQDSRFPIFVRRPDPLAITGPGGLAQTRGFASTPISPSAALSGLSFTGASGEQGATAQGSGGAVGFASPPQMGGLGYTLEIDLNQNGTFGDADDVVDATNDLTSTGANTFAWDGRDADGVAPACGGYAYRVRSTLAEVHLTQSDVEQSAGTRIERLSLPGDPALGDPFAASYNDIDPYKGTAVTDTSPSAVNQATSSPTFHAWSGTPTTGTGNADFVDTWMRLPEASASGTLAVCLPPAPPPPPPPPGAPPATNPTITPPSGDGRPGGSTERRPRLRLSKTVDRTRVRAGATASFTITVRNPSGGAVRDVRVCDRLPAGLVFERATPRAQVVGGRHCWTIRRLGADSSKALRLTVRALPGTGGRKTNRATATSPNAGSARASCTIRVLAAQVAGGGVTG